METVHSVLLLYFIYQTNLMSFTRSQSNLLTPTVQLYLCQSCNFSAHPDYPEWMARSLTHCGHQTLQLYPNNFIFNFNTVTNRCSLALNLRNTRSRSNDVISVVICDSSQGYYFYQYGRSMSCLLLSQVSMTYTSAKDFCESKSGFLVSVKTLDKLMTLRQAATLGFYWIGLDDIEQEGVFIGDEDKTEMTNATLRMIFPKTGPSNSNNKEDCVVFTGYLMNDIRCLREFFFICEMITFYV